MGLIGLRTFVVSMVIVAVRCATPWAGTRANSRLKAAHTRAWRSEQAQPDWQRRRSSSMNSRVLKNRRRLLRVCQRNHAQRLPIVLRRSETVQHHAKVVGQVFYRLLQAGLAVDHEQDRVA